MITAFLPLIDFIVKIALYCLVLKLRKIDARLMTCIMCAGASFLTGMIPFPELLHVMLTIAIAAFFLVRDTDTEIYPNGILIPLAVEIFDAFLLRYAVSPLLSMVQ